MTPDEAVKKMVSKGVLVHNHPYLRKWTQELIDACVATAKAEATKNETLRCVARVKMWSVRQPGVSIARQRSITAELVNDLLITGELEVDG